MGVTGAGMRMQLATTASRHCGAAGNGADPGLFDVHASPITRHGRSSQPPAASFIPSTERSSMNSIGNVLDRHRGIGPGFDFLRVFLAVCIVFVHALLATG